MIDLIYTAHNRLEFTQKTLQTLTDNTAWRLISSATIYDDASVDGTSAWLREFVACNPLWKYRGGKFDSTVYAIRNTYCRGPGRYIAKIDNDTMVPPHWLEDCVKAMDATPSIDLLGIEAITKDSTLPVLRDPVLDGLHVPRDILQTDHIGGIGIFRSSVFDRCGLPQMQSTAYNGFTEWQHSNKDRLHVGWLTPPLPVCLLDHVPFEPWASLTARYIEKGWMREGWGTYNEDERTRTLWSWWAPSE